MKIGIAGPISTESIKELLNGDVAALPRGYGGAPFLGSLIKTLIKHGHQVSAYTLDNSLPPQQLHPICAEGKNFKIYYCPLRRHSIRPNAKYLGRSLDFFYREIKSLKIAMQIDKPDIVHAHWSYEFALAAIYSKIPYLITCHDSPLKILKYMPGYYRFGRLLMALWVFYKSKYLTVVSPYVKGEINFFTNADISVIPNPTPIDLQENLSTIESGIDLSQPKIVMILNGWGMLKNPKPAMFAFSELLKTRPNATLHMFGADFQVGGKANQWSQEMNIDKNMIFHGPTPNADLLRFLQNATLLLHPSLEECCPMTLIEAMSLGIPVVGGEKSGGVPWVVNYGDSGVLVDISNVRAIAKSINDLLDDKYAYQKLRNNGFERIQKLFRKDVVVAAYISAYESVLTVNKP